jgi:hypothetical protein
MSCAHRSTPWRLCGAHRDGHPRAGHAPAALRPRSHPAEPAGAALRHQRGAQLRAARDWSGDVRPRRCASRRGRQRGRDRDKLQQVLVNLLANAIKFARGMGGDLRAESTLGTGSVFTLALPRGLTAVSARPAAPPLPTYAGAPCYRICRWGDERVGGSPPSCRGARTRGCEREWAPSLPLHRRSFTPIQRGDA